MFFRESTRQRAETLGVTGYARNLPDGRVEVLACGERAAVQELVRWLWQGPPAAHVSDVAIESVDPTSIDPWPLEFRRR